MKDKRGPPFQIDRHIRFRQPIYRYLRARTSTDDDAADLAQQVFLKVFEALPRYEDRGLPISAWLFRIARNTVIDAARRTHPTLPLDELSEMVLPAIADEPEAAALSSDALTRFQELIALLDTERQDLLALRFVAELPTAEIAIILGKSDAAVRAQLSRALASLKELYHA